MLRPLGLGITQATLFLLNTTLKHNYHPHGWYFFCVFYSHYNSYIADENAVLQALAALGASLPISALTTRELGRQRPRLNNTKRAIPKLDEAFDKRVDELRPGATVQYDIAPAYPPEGISGYKDAFMDSNKYAGVTRAGVAPPTININPNADRAYFAHELGHLASRQSDIGHLVASLRANPKLKTALMASMIGLPAVSAAMQEGDDDLDTSLAIAGASALPTLIDEGLATKNGLAIMNTAGLRASLGQRGKLAGGLLSYVAAPMLIGAAGNAAGNMIDSDPFARSRVEEDPEMYTQTRSTAY